MGEVRGVVSKEVEKSKALEEALRHWIKVLES